MKSYLKALTAVTLSLSLPVIGNSYAETYDIVEIKKTPVPKATAKPAVKNTASTPKPVVTPKPTPKPTVKPSVKPTAIPTIIPTSIPTVIATVAPTVNPTPIPTPKVERNVDDVDVSMYNQVNNIEFNSALVLKIINSTCSKSPDSCNTNEILGSVSKQIYEELKSAFPISINNTSQEKIKFMIMNAASIKDRLGNENILKLTKISEDAKSINNILYSEKKDEIVKLANSGTSTTSGNPFTEATPNPSPTANPYENGRIVFVSERDENPEIYVMAPNGKNPVRLTDNNAFDIMPTFSPDGSKIAFVSERDGNPEIYIMNNDGSNVVRLTNNYSYDYSPSWSPDGSKLIFVSNRGDTNVQGSSPVTKISFKIYTMNVDGSNQTKLTENSFEDEAPRWSPDGSKIAFVSKRDGNPEIYVMNSDGTNITRLTNSPTFDIMPAWSPDGTKIAFRSDRDGNPEIYTMNNDGTNLKRVTRNLSSDESPAWSPDGTKLLFVSRRDNIKNANEDFVNEIYVMNADSSNIFRLTNNSEDDNYPSWTKY